MTLSQDLIKEIIEKSVLTYKSREGNELTEEVHDESFSSDDEEIYVKVGVLEYTVAFELYHSWSCYHSGGNGWDDESYYYPENEETEITITAILDHEGEEYDTESISSDNMTKMEEFVADKLWEDIK